MVGPMETMEIECEGSGEVTRREEFGAQCAVKKVK
jgi:hypothetical protein